MLRVSALSLAALTLGACGSIHPGDAIIVDDETVSMATLNETADIYCAFTARSAESSGQAAGPIDNAAVRQQAATDLAKNIVAADFVKDENISVDEELTALTSQQEEQLRSDFGDEADQAVDVLEDNQLLYARLIAIGAAATGQTPNEDILGQLAQTGEQIVVEMFGEHDVEFAPRLGLADDGSAVEGGGSLSVAMPDVDRLAPADVSGPAGCSA